jgi:hypothetical protein
VYQLEATLKKMQPEPKIAKASKTSVNIPGNAPANVMAPQLKPKRQAKVRVIIT